MKLYAHSINSKVWSVFNNSGMPATHEAELINIKEIQQEENRPEVKRILGMGALELLETALKQEHSLYLLHKQRCEFDQELAFERARNANLKRILEGALDKLNSTNLESK